MAAALHNFIVDLMHIIGLPELPFWLLHAITQAPVLFYSPLPSSKHVSSRSKETSAHWRPICKLHTCPVGYCR